MNESQAEAVMAALGPQLEWSSRQEHSSFHPCPLLTFYRAIGTFGNEYGITGEEERNSWLTAVHPGRGEETVLSPATFCDETFSRYKRLADAKVACERHNATGVWEPPTPFDKLMILGGEAFWNNLCGTACEVLETVLYCAEQIKDKDALAHVQALASSKALQLGSTVSPGDEADSLPINAIPDATDEVYARIFTQIASRASQSYCLLGKAEVKDGKDVSDVQSDASWVVRQEWYESKWEVRRRAEVDTL